MLLYDQEAASCEERLGDSTLHPRAMDCDKHCEISRPSSVIRRFAGGGLNAIERLCEAFCKQRTAHADLPFPYQRPSSELHSAEAIHVGPGRAQSGGAAREMGMPPPAGAGQLSCLIAAALWRPETRHAQNILAARESRSGWSNVLPARVMGAPTTDRLWTIDQGSASFPRKRPPLAGSMEAQHLGGLATGGSHEPRPTLREKHQRRAMEACRTMLPGEHPPHYPPLMKTPPHRRTRIL